MRPRRTGGHCNLTGMDANTSNFIVEKLISYLGLIMLLTFHEFGHAWTALKCGDDTARLQGRVSLNPIVQIHPDWHGSAAAADDFPAPSISRFMIGWAKPVPVNAYNLRNPRRDDILVTMAGPAMNLILAVALVALARVGLMVHQVPFAVLCCQYASTQPAALLLQSYSHSAAGRLARTADFDRYELGNLRQLCAVGLSA